MIDVQETSHSIHLTDRRVTHLLWLTAVVAVALLVLVPVTLSARSNTDEVARGFDLASCRAEIRAEINQANSLSMVVILDGLAAFAAGDGELLADLVDQVPTIHADMEAATAAYDAALTRSIEDPEGFLADCQGDEHD